MINKWWWMAWGQMPRSAASPLIQLSDVLTSVRRSSLSCLLRDVSISFHRQEPIALIVFYCWNLGPLPFHSLLMLLKTEPACERFQWRVTYLAISSMNIIGDGIVQSFFLSPDWEKWRISIQCRVQCSNWHNQFLQHKRKWIKHYTIH